MPVENRKLFGINVLVDGLTKNLIRIETLDGAGLPGTLIKNPKNIG